MASSRLDFLNEFCLIEEVEFWQVSWLLILWLGAILQETVILPVISKNAVLMMFELRFLRCATESVTSLKHF